VQSSILLNKILVDEVDVKISCKVCDDNGIESKSKAYLNSNPLEIVLCTNRLNKDSIEKAIIHESIHAYDFAKGKCDFSTCEGLAYSEIRAAREADCSDKWFKNLCIKRNSKSCVTNFYSKKKASKCVNSVFKKAMLDQSPVVENIEKK
jgi:hypothetical protein